MTKIDIAAIIDNLGPSLQVLDKQDDDHDLPSYRDVGRILFHLSVLHDGSSQDDRYEIDVLDYDGSAFWIQEGTGIDYWINHLSGIDLELDGTYVIEGITGYYYKGTWGFDDDDEEFYFETVRRASEAEVSGEALDG